MSGFIDWNTSCPWQLYIFAAVHVLAGVFWCFLDICTLIFATTTQCSGSELVMSRLLAISILYVGAIFGVLTHGAKDSPGKTTVLSNVALQAATALTVAVLYLGKSERPWMHLMDFCGSLVLMGILGARVMRSDAVWAPRRPLRQGLGINCKSLVLLFVVSALIKTVALSDLMDPTIILAEAKVDKMTDLAGLMWTMVVVMCLECFLGLLYSLLFEEDHEPMIWTVLVMTLVGFGSILPINQHMSAMYDMHSWTAWSVLAADIVVCLGAIYGTRRGRRATQYESIGEEGTSLKV